MTLSWVGERLAGMLMAENPDITPFIGTFIENDRLAVRFYLVFAGLVVMLGILIAGLMFDPTFKNINSAQDLGQKIGGVFISILGLVPFKELLRRRDRLRILLVAGTQMQSASSDDEIKISYWN